MFIGLRAGGAFFFLCLLLVFFFFCRFVNKQNIIKRINTEKIFMFLWWIGYLFYLIFSSLSDTQKQWRIEMISVQVKTKSLMSKLSDIFESSFLDRFGTVSTIAQRKHVLIPICSCLNDDKRNLISFLVKSFLLSIKFYLPLSPELLLTKWFKA